MATMGASGSHKTFKRLESQKSYSWWWNSHINRSRNSTRWLSDNLEEMDKRVKRMLKLIEEDADSLTKKAEMYYQKRPELITLVEDFYRMYRSMAERYDNVLVEFRKNPPPSESSGISELSLEFPSTEQRLTRRRSVPRPAGFDFFLGSDYYQKEEDESSSLTDSELESDDSSVNNYPPGSASGAYQGINRKMTDLEFDLREAKEKLHLQQEDGSLRRVESENFVDQIAAYEQELKEANHKIQVSGNEIERLKNELQKCKSSDFIDDASLKSEDKVCKTPESELDTEEIKEVVIPLEIEGETKVLDGKTNDDLVGELRNTRKRLRDADKEIAALKLELVSLKSASNERLTNLQNQLELAQRDTMIWNNKLNSEKRQVSKLQERIAMLKSSLLGRDHEIRDLKTALSDAEQNIFTEKAEMKAEVSKLQEERNNLEEQLREVESRGRCLEEKINKITNEKIENDGRLSSEIEKLKTEIDEIKNIVVDLNESLEAVKEERGELNAEVNSLKTEISSKNNRIEEKEKHLEKLETEHQELMADAEAATQLMDALKSRAKELEEGLEKQRMKILEGAEEKREVIRQLCFSIEHYRGNYIRLLKPIKGSNDVTI